MNDEIFKCKLLVWGHHRNIDGDSKASFIYLFFSFFSPFPHRFFWKHSNYQLDGLGQKFQVKKYDTLTAEYALKSFDFCLKMDFRMLCRYKCCANTKCKCETNHLGKYTFNAMSIECWTDFIQKSELRVLSLRLFPVLLLCFFFPSLFKLKLSRLGTVFFFAPCFFFSHRPGNPGSWTGLRGCEVSIVPHSNFQTTQIVQTGRCALVTVTACCAGPHSKIIVFVQCSLAPFVFPPVFKHSLTTREGNLQFLLR